MDEPLVQLESVTMTYGTYGKYGAETPVLREVELRIGRGESVAVTGPSGSGKSTLLNLVGGLDRPSAGRIVVDGQDTALLDATGLAELRRRAVGFVFQGHHLLGGCTVLENVLLPTLATRSRSTAAEVARARELLGRVGLGDREGSWPGELSGGERQRVAVVRALINEPRLLLADEPTGSLDRASSEALGDLLLELRRELGTTLVVASHSAALAARMERTLRIEDGRVVESP